MVQLIYQNYSQEIINRNLPIWMSFEPGSTFKIVTYAAGLEENVFKMDESFYDIGYRNVAGTIIKDWKKGGHQRQKCVFIKKYCIKNKILTLNKKTTCYRMLNTCF